MAPGIEVELGRIDRELKKLWEADGGSTRASLINFAVYCEGEAAMERNTALIAGLTQDHACRALLICCDPGAPASSVQAWISAHCHLSRAGAKQVCCEQLSFLLRGESRQLIPNIVFSHLDSDLPLHLWWQGEFRDPLDEHLWKWVDRLYYDSQAWSQPAPQLALARTAADAGGRRTTLRDLNWTRSLHLRQAIAQLFDHPANLARLDALDCCTLTHAPGYRSTAAFVAGWLATQLGWKSEGRGSFATGSGKLTLELRERAGASIGECALSAGDASFTVTRQTDAEFYRNTVKTTDGTEHHHLVPAGPRSIEGLLNEDLSRAASHDAYLRALEAAEELL